MVVNYTYIFPENMIRRIELKYNLKRDNLLLISIRIKRQLKK